ncbi:MAG: aminotransferase class IV [Chloroflexi bacterium]|nr:aminotransferase class IV [Chloroflexota bacterium]MCC6892477.1 aminotransferase class IV family protein [Anaerolineae bacterium]
MSPTLIKILTPNGLQLADYTANSLADAVKYEPHDGIYTLTNTFNHGQVLKMDAHLDRLEDSGRRVGMAFKLDRPAIRKALRQMLDESGYGDVRFRITIPQAEPDRITLSIEPFSGHPAETYINGIRCITLKPSVTRVNPAAKTTGWMHDRDAVATPPGIFSGILLDETGDLLEGTSNNFYAIIDGELRTAGSGVLAGIAQQIIFEVAPNILPVNRTAVNVRDIPRFSEAFLSGSSRGIVPLVEIDGIMIGDGKPGAITKQLREAYAVWLNEHLEDL